MSATRIKSLQSASPLVENQFNEMEFIVDVAHPDSTLKLTGRELREAVGLKKHIHPLEEVDGLAGELEKKLDKAGGTITGDLTVQGKGKMKSLTIEEYLEVPEIKYNRITATGSEFWVTDAGIIDDWWEVDGVYCITLKAKEGEQTIGFEVKDILRGVFHTQKGFTTAYFEVMNVFDSENFDCISLNEVPPARFMALVRQGNKNNLKRQGSVYLDGLRKQIKVLDGVKDKDITLKNLKVLLGDLSDIAHPLFGQLSGFGALLENAYISGRLVQKNADTGEEWAIGAVSVSGEQLFHYNSEGVVDKETILLTATEQGFSSEEYERAWQYKLGADWLTIDDERGLTLTLRHDDTLWLNRKVIAIRYRVELFSGQGSYDDVITLSKSYDGQQGNTPCSVSITGETLFKIADLLRPVTQPSEVALFGVDSGFTSTQQNRRWQFKRNGEWVDINGAIDSMLVVQGDAGMWDDQPYLPIRYVVELERETLFAITTLTKLYDGESSCYVAVESEEGTIFKNGQIGSTLSARVYRGTEELTDLIHANDFRWYRTSKYPQLDEVWNNSPPKLGKSIFINHTDVDVKAVFNCEVRINPSLP